MNIESSELSTQQRGPSPVRWIVHVVLAVGGLLGVAFFIHQTDLSKLGVALAKAAPWLPIVVALEGLRIGLDGLTTRALYGPPGKCIPMRVLFRVHLSAYPLNLLLPAGRAAGEALKALTLKAYVPTERAIAAAIINPALALLGGAAISLPCLAFALRAWGSGPVTIAIGVQCLTAFGLAIAIVIAGRSGGIGSWAQKWSRRLGTSLVETQRYLRALPLIPVVPVLLQFAGRVGLVLELTVLVTASGGSPQTGWLATGVHLVGAAVGDVVPAQLGATDGAFAWAAPNLQMTAEEALAVPLLFHAVQCFWAAVGALSSLWLTAAPAPNVHKEETD